MASVSDIRNSTRLWTYDYYGQHAVETIPAQLNWMTERKTPLVDINGDTIADVTIIPEHLAYATHNIDLAINGGMEIDDHSWTNKGTPSINQQSTTHIYSDGGSYSRKIVTNAINDGIQGTIWSLFKGKSYSITAHVYIEAPSSGT